MPERMPCGQGRARPPRSRRRAVAGLAAGALLVAAGTLLWWASRPEPAGQTVSVVGVRDALALTTGGDASPTPDPTPAGSPTPPTTMTGPPPTTVPTAPTTTGTGPPAQATPPPSSPPPVRLSIPRLEIDAPVVPIGVADDGQIQVPGDVRSVGWYRFGPAPGDTGSAVLVGHVDDHLQGAGVLARIGDLGPGDPIGIDDNEGGTHAFTVVSREQWTKSQIPMGRLFDRGGQPRLVLITCGGAFDANRLQYDDNIAITAVPVPG